MAVLTLGTVSMADAQSAVEKLQPLVETTARRLTIAEQVALSKWDSGKAVEDAPREAQVIQSAVKDGAAKGLDEASVSSFFNAQIEANEVFIAGLIREGQADGSIPRHVAADDTARLMICITQGMRVVGKARLPLDGTRLVGVAMKLLA